MKHRLQRRALPVHLHRDPVTHALRNDAEVLEEPLATLKLRIVL
jgi:hypothetical protein